MIKVSVFYPATPGARFDHDYYRDRHMPLVKARMGDACLSYTIDRGISGGQPGTEPPFVGMCHIFAETPETFAAAFGPYADEILGDVSNYTDITPVMQISQVIDVPGEA